MLNVLIDLVKLIFELSTKSSKLLYIRIKRLLIKNKEGVKTNKTQEKNVQDNNNIKLRRVQRWILFF